MTPELRATLEAQRDSTETLEAQRGAIIPWVFHRRASRIRDCRKAWRQACRGGRACPGRIPHDFRRTAVRNLERAGVPRSAAMKMVGHKTEAIYRRYAIVDEACCARGRRSSRRRRGSAGDLALGTILGTMDKVQCAMYRNSPR